METRVSSRLRQAAFLAAVLLFACGTWPAMADTAVTFRAAQQTGYARLVFEGGSGLIDETRISGNILYIRFKEPVDMDATGPAAELADYVSSASLSRGHTILSLTLKKSVVLKTADLGNAAMVDLIDTAGKVNDGPLVTVRVGEHGDFDRVVFDWPKEVPYKIAQDGRTVTVTFDAPALPDLAQIYADPPPLIRSADVDPKEDSLAVIFHLSAPAEVTSFRDGPRVAVDFHPAEKDAGTAARTPETEAMEQASAEQSPAAGKPEETATPAPQPGAPFEHVQVEEEAAAPAEKVTLEVSAIASGTRLRLPLPGKTAAAVFSRAGYLWLVLKGNYDIDLSALETADNTLVHGGELSHVAGATILRVGMDPAFQTIARGMNNSWEVDLTLYPAAPVNPLQVSRQDNADLGPIVFIPVDNAPDYIEVNDPEVGDRLAIVPLPGNGQGLVEARRFSEFAVLKSAQGIAVQLIADSAKVTHFANGIALSGGRGLGAVSARAGGKPDKAPVPVQAEAPVPFVDFAGWKRGPDSEYQTIKDDLMDRLALADDKTRNGRRFDVATFYLANDMATEAMAYLELMSQDDPAYAQDAHFLAVRGISNYKMRRFDKAAADLSHPDLAKDPNVALWRSLVAVAQGQWQQAYDEYRQGLEVLATYPEPVRARFQLAEVKAARKLGDMETAKRELMVLSNYELPKTESSEVSLLMGEVYADEDDSEKALTKFDDTIAADYRPTRVRAEYDRVAELVAKDAISFEEATAELERLRYVWRGDDLELKCLRLLAQLYLKHKNYRDALSRMRTAVTQFNGTPEARQTAREMGDVFRDLFLNGGTDDMMPVRALALYYDFRELTPIGYEGDQMIRRLADRLVKVDLLDKAEELLEHQVNFRLDGAAKAQVAENLAVVYLLDRKPEKALEAIRDSEQPQLPEDINTRRRHLEARALTDLNKYDEAGELLKDDETPGAVALKADLYWKAEDWANSVVATRALIRQKEEQGEEPDYNQILRLAVATSLAGDEDALPGLAKEFGEEMKGGPYARTFDLITSDTPTSSTELRDIINSVADVSSYEKYLADYKNELSTAEVKP